MTRRLSEHELEKEAWEREKGEADDADEFDPLYHRDPDPEFDPDDREYDAGWSDDLQNRYERERMEHMAAIEAGGSMNPARRVDRVACPAWLPR